MFKYFLFAGFLALSLSSKAAKPSLSKSVAPKKSSSGLTLVLLTDFQKKMSNAEIKKLKEKTLSMGGKAVPALIKVMKSEKHPEKSRWVATFLLGKIMGKKASPFISKFVTHPNWFMRMASLKTLLALGEKKFAPLYGRALSDKSYLVRSQALENIRVLNLRDQAPRVWAMLYNKQNYYGPSKNKRTSKGRKKTKIKAS